MSVRNCFVGVLNKLDNKDMDREQEINNQIIEFIKTHDLISVNALEASLNIPRSTIGQAMNGSRQLPLKHLFVIIRALIPYGFKLDGYDWSLDDLPYVPNIYGSKQIGELTEIEEDGHYLYLLKQVRTIACDISDLL